MARCPALEAGLRPDSGELPKGVKEGPLDRCFPDGRIFGVLFWFCYSFFYTLKLFKEDCLELNEGTGLAHCCLCQEI